MNVLARFYSLEPDEAPRVGWLFVHSLCIGFFVAFFFSAANAIFLGHYGAGMLPWAYVGSGLFGAIVVRAFKQLRCRLAFTTMLFAQLGFVAVVVGGLYLTGVLLPEDSRRVVAFALFLVVGPALTLVNLEFWGLVRRLFNVRQSKKFNPLVATGETVASIVGFFLVPLLQLSDTIHLLALSLVGLAGSIVIVAILSRRFASELLESRSGGGDPVARRQSAEAPKDRYFKLAAVVMGLAVVAQYMVDFSFLSELKKQYSSPEQVAAFIGVFYGAVKVLDLLMKSFVSGRLVQQFGLRSALRVLPAALLFSTLFGLAFGSNAKTLFLLVALTKLLWPVLRKSVFDPAFKVLYQPLPEAQSQGLQSSIDGTVRQVGTFLAGLLLLFLNWAEVGPRVLLVGLVLVLVAWFGLIGPLHREYRARLVAALNLRRPSPLVRSPFAALRQWLAEAPEDERGRARRLLADVEPDLIAAVDEGLDVQVLDRLERAFARQDDRALRCRILELYSAIDGERTDQLLVSKLSFPDTAVRQTAVRILVARGYRARDEVAARLRDGIEDLARDVGWNLAALVDLGEEPHLEGLRLALEDEIAEQRRQVFLMLALLYESHAVSLARDGLRASEDGAESAANALELLENLMAEELRPLVFPVVEDLPPGVALKRLRNFVAYRRLGWRRRLDALVQRDPARLSSRVRTWALLAIASSCEPGEVAEQLVAHLFHADSLLQEIAAESIGRLDPEQYRRRLAKLPFDLRKRLLRTVDLCEEPWAAPRTVIARMGLLDDLEIWGELSWSAKRALAMSFGHRVLAPGETWGAHEPDGSLAVLVAPSVETAPTSWISERRREAFRADVETHLLCIDGASLRQLLRRHTELVLAVLEMRRRSGSPPRPRPHVTDLPLTGPLPSVAAA